MYMCNCAYKVFSKDFIGQAALTLLFLVLFKLYSLLLEVNDYQPASVRQRGEAHRWFNTIVSLTHSVLASVCYACAIFIDGNVLLHLERSSGSSLPLLLSCFTLGYFVHDFMHAFTNRRLLDCWPILLHHVTSILCFLCLMGQGYHNFITTSIGCEINSVFLHIRQILKLKGDIASKSIYRLNHYTAVFTFIVFRFCSLIWLGVWAMKNRQHLPSPDVEFGLFGLSVMLTINVGIFIRLSANKQVHKKPA